MTILKRLTGLLLALLLGPLASCTTAQTWHGFSGPAYLPAKPVHYPAPTPASPASAEVRRLDSLTARLWSIPPCQQRPLVPRTAKR